MGMLPVPVPSKDVAKEIEAGAKSFFGLVQRLLRLSEEQRKHAALIEKQAAEIKAQNAEIAALRDAIHALQTREDVILARAETVAIRSASAGIADLARRIGHLEATRDKHQS
jgi:Tfp pilus assembly protein PilN